MKTRHQAHLSLAFPRFHKLSSKRETCTLASEQNSPPNRRRSFPLFSLLSPSSRQKNHFFFFSFSLSFLLWLSSLSFTYKSRGENNFLVPFEIRDRIDREKKEVALLSALSLETTREKLGATRKLFPR